MKWIAYGAGLLLGIIPMLLPQPFDKLALALFVISFLIVILIGHKAAFRAHPLGLFGQYKAPSKVLGQKLSIIERKILKVSLMVIAGLGIGLLYKVNAG